MPSKHHNKKKDTKRLLFIPNSLFLVCFSSISSKFGEWCFVFWQDIQVEQKYPWRDQTSLIYQWSVQLGITKLGIYPTQIWPKDHGRVPFDHKFRFEFRNFRMSNGTVFSTRPDRSRSIPSWTHALISHQELLDKMLKDCDEVAVLSAVSCFMKRSLNSGFEINFFVREPTDD